MVTERAAWRCRGMGARVSCPSKFLIIFCWFLSHPQNSSSLAQSQKDLLFSVIIDTLWRAKCPPCVLHLRCTPTGWPLTRATSAPSSTPHNRQRSLPSSSSNSNCSSRPLLLPGPRGSPRKSRSSATRRMGVSGLLRTEPFSAVSAGHG